MIGAMLGRAGCDRTRGRPRATRHGADGRRVRRIAQTLGAFALVLAGTIPVAQAAPVRGVGKATAAETKTPNLAQARVRALRRARRAALEAALSQVTAPVDPAARKAVLGATEAWTGAYRILSERSDGEAVDLEVEVEIDLVRLTKRVAKRQGDGGRPRFRLGAVGASERCGDADAVAAVVRTELSGQGAVVLDGAGGKGAAKAPVLDVALDCRPLGPVRHTYLQAVQVTVTATSGGDPVAELTVPEFATTPPEATAAGIQRALTDAASRLVAQRTGHVRLRVQSPLPSVRVRRLETALRNSVLGVDEVEVGALSRGVVELHVRGELTAKALARSLSSLTLPGFSLTVVDVDPPDALTIRLE